MPDRPGLEIRLLGPLEVLVGNEPIVVDTRKALAIVALVAAEGRPYARDELAVMFWPDADDEAARGALRRTLSALRSAVGQRGLRIDRSRVALEPDVTVDLRSLERLAASDDLRDLGSAAELARGPFLAGFALRDSPEFDDWQAARASRVERLVGELLDRLAAARLTAGDAGGALEAARRRVELDPLDEAGQRRLIDLLARSGDRTGAIAQYRSLVALFDRELGVAPLRETTELYEEIREGRLAAAVAPDAVASAGPEAPPALPMVGRDAESAVLIHAWRAAAPDGHPAIVEGEAGIGKTRLADALVAEVRRHGGVVLAARGYPGEATIPYGPIAELIRAGLALPDGIARLGSLDDITRQEIGRLVDLPASIRLATPAGPEVAGSRVRLLDAIARTLAAIGGGPVPGLVVVDDLHLVDPPSVEAIAWLARRFAGRPLLLLLVLRREDLTPEAASVIDDLARLPGSTSVVLERLSRSAVAELVRAARPDLRGGPAGDHLVETLTTDSEGLPLHVVEALASRTPFDGDVPSLPRGVQAILHDRIAAAGETAGQVLSAAAVIGRSFDLGTVRQASGRSEEETVDALDELVRRGLVRELPDAPGSPLRYDFAHGRLRDVAYAETSLARRRLLHRRTADALRQEPGSQRRDDIAHWALIGAHEREAGRTAEAAQAYRDAADRAERVYANRVAIEHLEAALALGWPDATGVRARLGELHARLGEYPAAVAALETAAAGASAQDLPGIELALGRVHRRRGDLAAADSHLASVLAAPDVMGSVRTRALVERSLVALQGGSLASAEAAADEAGRSARASADRHDEGVAERLKGLIAQQRGDAPTALAALERSQVLAADDPDPAARIAALTATAIAMAGDGRVEDAVSVGSAAVAACREIGDRHLEAAVENHLADLLHAAGREADAMEHLKRAVALFAEIGEGAPEREPGIWSLAAW